MALNRARATTYVLVVAVLGGCLGACAPCPGPPADVGIVPGESLAGIRLAQPLQTAIDLHGNPSVQGLTFSYESLGLSGAVSDDNGNRIADSTDRVIEVRALEPYSGRTAGGNGVGSAVGCVAEEFGTPDRRSGDLVYSTRGIGFVTSARATPEVSIPQVFLAALAGTAVSVHEVIVFFDANTPFQPAVVPGTTSGG